MSSALLSRAMRASRLLPPATRSFSSSPLALNMARMSLIGRVVSEPKVKTTKNEKEFLIYTVATRDPLGPAEEGKEPEPTSSYHDIFAYGPAVDRLKKLEKGSLVHVDATFTLDKTKLESGEYTTRIFAHHDRLNVLAKPKVKEEDL